MPLQKDLAEQGEVDEDGVPEGDGPSLQGAVAGRHRHHHGVDGHEDLGKKESWWMHIAQTTLAKLFSFSPAGFQLG